jgi:hypothetical protein
MAFFSDFFWQTAHGQKWKASCAQAILFGTENAWLIADP